MKLFGKHEYGNLNDAVTYAGKCTSLRLLFPTYNLADKGQDFLKLNRLIELHIQGDYNIWDDYSFELPKEIGLLNHIRKLTLLNLPLKNFPEWIIKLGNLNYLTVRGTEITSIPDDIIYLRKLKTLRVKNCNLQTLPAGLSQMHQLKYLGLCHTRLKQVKANMFPPTLTQIDFGGTVYYNITNPQQLQP